uniref:F-box domain-containing protein n=1 Tax=Hemiselmis andersenii TaxID=464988 RepID=A0A6U2AUT3_HEMAN|mmetsp:Transcript_13963/g.32387  ORF Transcript_13963/g.32387 Transcript_13963/m.32387 type:complete len:134 (-) Transcript_13963:199-600(-)
MPVIRPDVTDEEEEEEVAAGRQAVGVSVNADSLRHVVTFLPAHGLAVLSSVSRETRRLCDGEELWRVLLKRDFGCLFPSDGLTCKATYCKAFTEWVLWRDGKPDYVEFRGNHEPGVWSKVSAGGKTVELLCQF